MEWDDGGGIPRSSVIDDDQIVVPTDDFEDDEDEDVGLIEEQDDDKDDLDNELNEEDEEDNDQGDIEEEEEILEHAGTKGFVEAEGGGARDEEEEEAEKGEDEDDDEDDDDTQTDNQLISESVYDGSIQPTPSADERNHGALDALLAAAASNEVPSEEQTPGKAEKPTKKKDDKVWIPANRHIPLDEHQQWREDTIKWVEKHMKDHKVTNAQLSRRSGVPLDRLNEYLEQKAIVDPRITNQIRRYIRNFLDREKKDKEKRQKEMLEGNTEKKPSHKVQYHKRAETRDAKSKEIDPHHLINIDESPLSVDALPEWSVPIEISIDHEGYHVQERILWNLKDDYVDPEDFAAAFCKAYHLPASSENEISESIRSQVSKYPRWAPKKRGARNSQSETVVDLEINVEVEGLKFHDKLRWDLLDRNTNPRTIATQICTDLRLPAFAVSAIDNEIRNQIKKKTQALWQDPENVDSFVTCSSTHDLEVLSEWTPKINDELSILLPSRLPAKSMYKEEADKNINADETQEDLEYFRLQEQMLRKRNDMLKSNVASPLLNSQFPAQLDQISSTPSGKSKSKGSSGRKGAKSSAMPGGNGISSFSQHDHSTPAGVNGTYQQMLGRRDIDLSIGAQGAGGLGMASDQIHSRNFVGDSSGSQRMMLETDVNRGRAAGITQLSFDVQGNLTQKKPKKQKNRQSAPSSYGRSEASSSSSLPYRSNGPMPNSVANFGGGRGQLTAETIQMMSEALMSDATQYDDAYGKMW